MDDYGRESILSYLKEEVVGPRTTGTPIDASASNVFTDAGSAFGPWIDVSTGQEILRNLKPTDRYGAGILHPKKKPLTRDLDDDEIFIDDEIQVEFPDDSNTELEYSDSEEIVPESLDGDTESIIQDDARKPSSMGISFFAAFEENSQIQVKVSGGWYSKFSVVDATNKQSFTIPCYLRNEFELSSTIQARDFIGIAEKKLVVMETNKKTPSPIEIKLLAFIRPWGENKYLVTISVINETSDSSIAIESKSLFQTEFNVTFENSILEKYPKSELRTEHLEGDTYSEKARLDDQSTDLLFSAYPTLAIGHNCSVDWATDIREVKQINASCFPVYEAPSITPDIELSDGSSVNLDMRVFADPMQRNKAIQDLEGLVQEYEKWTLKEKSKFDKSPELAEYGDAFEANLAECILAAKRMRKGLGLLQKDDSIYEAFRLANKAMLLQQARSKLPLRKSGIRADGRIYVEGDHPSDSLPENVGKWRAFQIAFFLNVIESIANEDSSERDVVDLIFFPTGGGKTEAYLGVIAFTIALRRIRNSTDLGTTVIMRYTLRLLTTQQFSRAASLICALELMRRKGEIHLGKNQISIGAWLGSAVTPNRQVDAVKLLTSMKKDLKKRPWKQENPFLILQCPWCAASMGPVEKEMNAYIGTNPSIPGYEVSGMPRRVKFVCPDSQCDFHNALPLYVVDEDLYAFQPTLVIGTVDKFALLAWKSESRSLFGRDENGDQDALPPSLIIQDEFHLISGPLGSMVGLYETVIEHLATSIVAEKRIKPKIISSTATIRRFWAQANAVYGRTEVSLFPPPLRDVSDSFFAVWSRDKESGKLSQGRKYVGIYMPGTGSIRSSEVRVGSALALAPMRLETNKRDPWWTNLWFFNDLKQLGTAISLFHNDIAKYMPGLVRRDGITKRILSSPEELTSRRQNSEIPKVLQQLSFPYLPEEPTNKQIAWDTCLASNIIEVGIDVDRLSLMTVVGQPKSTAQYIQVSGRVGRRWWERPGLVVTLFAMGRPRDLSHFEHFRSYHEKLYAQVEPTSVTPFSIPVVQRALRGALTALFRTTLPMGIRPREITAAMFDEAADIFRKRFEGVVGTSDEESDYLEDTLETAKSELSKWKRDEWEGENGILRRQISDGAEERLTWAIPSSMRNVDASAALSITDQYFDVVGMSIEEESNE